MKRTMIGIAILAGLALTAVADGPLEVWTVDPIVKVFQDAKPTRTKEAFVEVARGEYASIQVVVRSGKAITGLTSSVDPLTLEGGGATLTPHDPRFVGYVPVNNPTTKPSKDQLRVPPALFPDPLLEVDQVDVDAGNAQPIWVTVKIPLDAQPGLYKGTLNIAATVGGSAAKASFPLSVHVYPVTIESTRLWVTNWFGINAAIKDAETQEYDDLVRAYARNMAEHRQNVALINTMGLANFGVNDQGALTVDFSRFDKMVEIFMEEGMCRRIEGGHIAGRRKGWTSDFRINIREVKDGKVAARRAEPDSDEARQFYSFYFPALVAHLKEKGWLDIYMQHLADEPIATNADTYQEMGKLVEAYGPELRTIDASHTTQLVGAIDIWVPQTNYLHKDYDFYQERQKAGDEVWMYTCVVPQEEYANRFIELPLIKTRLLHWINFRYNATGYLHWGYNKWRKDPYKDLTPPFWARGTLPAGDAWIVYPGKGKPWDSIRWEAMRDGIDDHELLSMLADRDPKAAHKIAKRHIRDFDKYNTSPKKFRATRRKLLKELTED
ncbi:MAG: DUF4091 domain-containing protein [bacterium]|nr:DUF4091 domain-containing protein [bacterium]